MEYTYSTHFALTIIGLIFLFLLIFTMRNEVSYLSEHKKYRFQYALSMVSILITLVLALTCLFHWALAPIFVFLALTILGPLLLMLAFLILILRARMIKDLTKDRMEEHKKLVIEVQEMIDEKKRERIRKGKISRGEDPNE
ncbi:MAG TPA: hypothetical protein ENN67_08215 [Firmicutes bacterium]|nr:hypothetical protein [Bacillota bacterium]